MSEVFSLNKDPFIIAVNKLESILNGNFIIGYMEDGFARIEFGSQINDIEAVYLIDMLDKSRDFDDIE